MNICKKIEFGAFLIKPDAIRLGIESNLIEDIGREGFDIELIKQVPPLCSRQLRDIWRGNVFPEYIWTAMERRNQSAGSTVVMVSPNGRPIETDIHGEIKKVKLDLRRKYPGRTKQQCERICSNIDQLAEMIGENRVHGTANEQEFIWLSQTLLTGRDMDGLRVDNNQLYSYLEQYI